MGKKRKKFEICSKYILDINEFLYDYVLADEEEKKEFKLRKLTHTNMDIYLFENGYHMPKRLPLDSVSKEEILSGKVVFVRDEIGRVIPYLNPIRLSIELVKNSLNTKEAKKEILRRRREILNEKGLIEGKNGEIFEKSDIFEKDDIVNCNLNRSRTLSRKNMHKMKGMVGLE